MNKSVIKRLLMLITVLLCVAFVLYAIMNVAEGDPVYSVVSADATEAQIEAAREELGLNGTLLERYFRYVKGRLTGDLGTSYVSKRDVMQTYLERLPNTLKLAPVTMVVALAISIPLGIIAAVNQNSIKDTIAMVLALLGLSMPNFWLGLLLIMLFSLKLGWLPSGGYENGMLSLILPAFTIGAGLAAFMTRSALYWYLLILWNDFIISIFIPSEPEKTDSRTKELIYKNIMIPVVMILNAVYFENALDKENIQIVYAVLIAGFIGLVQLPLFIWYAGRVKSHIRSAVFYRTNIDVSRVL